MNRRMFLCALPLAAVVAPMEPRPVKKWGEVTIERHRILKNQGIDLHVYHNGVDVTSRCRYADDEQGVAELYLLDERGLKYLDRSRNKPAIDVVRKGIEIRQV